MRLHDATEWSRGAGPAPAPQSLTCPAVLPLPALSTRSPASRRGPHRSEPAARRPPRAAAGPARSWCAWTWPPGGDGFGRGNLTHLCRRPLRYGTPGGRRRVPRSASCLRLHLAAILCTVGAAHKPKSSGGITPKIGWSRDRKATGCTLVLRPPGSYHGLRARVRADRDSMAPLSRTSFQSGAAQGERAGGQPRRHGVRWDAIGARPLRPVRRDGRDAY
jgi:hypothetical protein